MNARTMPETGPAAKRPSDFTRLWAGQTASVFGSYVGGVALQFVAILWLGASPVEISLLAAAQLVPGFLIGLVAGVWVDRLRRRPILIAADIGRALALATVPAAAFAGVLGMPHLVAVALVTSALGVFFDVAYEAHLPSLVGRDALVRGNSRLAATAALAEIGAFGLGGWLVQLLSAPGAVLVDAASFVVSGAAVASIRRPEPPPAPAEDRRPLGHEAVEGLRIVAREPVLRALAVANAALQLAGGLIGTVILVYLSRDVGFEPGPLGMIFAVGGASSLAGIWLAGRRRRRIGRSLVAAVAVRALGASFTPLTGEVSWLGVGLLVAAQLVSDPAHALYEIQHVSLRQAMTADRLRGRVNASMRFLEFAAQLAGTLAAGVLGQTVGLRATLWLAVAIIAATAAWLALSPVRRVDRLADDAESPHVGTA